MFSLKGRLSFPGSCAVFFFFFPLTCFSRSRKTEFDHRNVVIPPYYRHFSVFILFTRGYALPWNPSRPGVGAELKTERHHRTWHVFLFSAALFELRCPPAPSAPTPLLSLFSRYSSESAFLRIQPGSGAWRGHLDPVRRKARELR